MKSIQKFTWILLMFALHIIVARPALGQDYSVVISKTVQEKPNKKIVSHNLLPFQLYTFSNDSVTSKKVTSNKGFFNTIERKPGLAFLSSAAVPGIGQMANGQWLKAGIFLTIEAAALTYHFVMQNEGNNLTRDYHQYADLNWSVVKYARFLVDYHNAFYPNNPITYNSLANPGYQLGTSSANTRDDWKRVNINAVHQLERKTYYDGTSGNAFSHNLPDLGSQQYYELMSKYYQFGPGWKDFNTQPTQIVWEPNGMSYDWHLGAHRAADFNDHLRTASRMLTLVIVNHFVSAFDAYFTSKLHNERLHASVYYINDQNNGLRFQLSF